MQNCGKCSASHNGNVQVVQKANLFVFKKKKKWLPDNCTSCILCHLFAQQLWTSYKTDNDVDITRQHAAEKLYC